MDKKILNIAASGLLALGLVLSGSALLAQDSAPQDNPPSSPQGPPSGRAMHRGPMSADRQLDMMTHHLKLTDDQRSQIKPMLEAQQQKMESLRSDTSMTEQDRKTQMHSMMEDTHAKIRAVLTDSQQKQFDEMHGPHGEHMPPPPPDGAGNPPPPPPSSNR